MAVRKGSEETSNLWKTRNNIGTFKSLAPMTRWGFSETGLVDDSPLPSIRGSPKWRKIDSNALWIKLQPTKNLKLLPNFSKDKRSKVFSLERSKGSISPNKKTNNFFSKWISTQNKAWIEALFQL